jgi:hypothetical protein
MPAEKLGQPCWIKDHVDQAIRPIARTDKEGIDYFLASHTPINNIRHDETDELFNEETLFHNIFSSKGEVLALIHGNPGTGKSHLIHWLKLRTEDALKNKAFKEKVVPVLIQRRTGTLKDALEQIIEQLGEQFSGYLSDVRTALSKISSDTAREKLIGDIGLELRPQQRANRNREPLPNVLKDLAEVCVGSKGFRDWLSREGGVSDRIIKHLTEDHTSETDEIEDSLPKFTSKELFPDVHYKRNDIRIVLDLLDEFDLEPELAEQAAKYFNEVLPDAIKQMTGLSGTNLQDIFDRIRADLKKRGETLALFIEDVSVMSALDEEVFLAVEPRTGNNLCRMIAVLGSTNEGWNRLPDNQKQRVTHPISLGETADASWKDDPESVAKFAARYMNTVRLSNEQINSVAEYRRSSGKDINISACDNCPVREECHLKFGKVQVGTVEVGTFPLTLTAPKRLLNNLKDSSAARKNARGLLTKILLPVLEDGFVQLQERRFPNATKFAVSINPIPFWTGFKQGYCGNWSDFDIDRLEFLAQGWVNAEGANDLAGKLEPFLEPLGLPKFSKQPSTIASNELKKENAQQQQIITPRKKESPATNTRLNKILQSLDDWFKKKEKLQEDVEIRKLLAELVRNSIRWEDVASVPLEVWKSAIGGANDYGFVRIEDQFHSPQAQTMFIDFPRDEETRNVIEALTQFRYAGNRSWDFEHGEHHKRVVAQWLRRNQQNIIKQLELPQNLDANVPLKSAVQIISTTVLVRQKTNLSPEMPELLKSVLTDSWNEDTSTLSREWKSLLDDMKLTHKKLLGFIMSELNVPQGRTGGINFINSVPVLKAALDFAAQPKIEIPGEDYFQSYWKSRFSVLQNKNKYSNFVTALEAERSAIDEVVRNIRFNLRRVGYNTDQLHDAISEFCSDLNDLLITQKEAKTFYPYDPFDRLMKDKIFTERKNVWRTAVKNAEEVAAGDDLMQVMKFDSQNLVEVDRSLAIALEYIAIIEKDIETQNENLNKEGDPLLLEENLLKTLEEIENLN